MEIDISKIKPDIRYLDDVRKVLQDQEWSKKNPNFELYYMYRKLKIENELVYNVTVIPAKMLGKEFMKTKGHVHIGNYGETYTVLEGEAIFFMQKTKGDIVEDAYVVETKKGQTALIKGGYGHITINPSKNQDLKTEDWSSVNCKSDYSLFEKLQGGCYYYTVDGWVKNPNYKNIPPIRFEKALDSLPKDLSFLKQG
jgi:glucose-6-phosphate isomerase